jgi:hypothetical protein
VIGDEAIPVRESPGIHDISWKRVEHVLPHLPRPVAAIVQIMRFSNCRAQDAVLIRTCDLFVADDEPVDSFNLDDRLKALMISTGELWAYRPESHKNQWREEHSEIHKRLVYLGQRCQKILLSFLRFDQPEAYLFSPRDAKADFQAQRAAQRTTKRTPSEMKRQRKVAPKRAPRERYDVSGVQQSIRKTCERLGVQGWKLLEVRHTRATEIRDEYGVEGASASLGNTIEAAQIYAEHNRNLARKIAHEKS